MQLRHLNINSTHFKEELQLARADINSISVNVEQVVKSILDDVKNRGDRALLAYTNQFDERDASINDIEIPASELQEALATIPEKILNALQHAANRLRDYHEKQIMQSWQYEDAQGNRLGQKVTALDRVGIYVPGGKASYPSSVLMNAIPANVAGVSEIIMVVPTPRNEKNSLVLAAAAISNIDRVFSIGGAQSVAALAYGTTLVPKVDKIVGPGNSYVTAAKKQVFGSVGIDMIAGPSEVLIAIDDTSNPDWVAMDLFAQAEHDEDAQAILICYQETLLTAVEDSINKLLPTMERREIIQNSLEKNGLLILVNDISDMIDLINVIAPEHLQLCVKDAESLLPKIRHAGAIFVGNYAAEVLGDYCAGPNHVLPTSGTARFSSPLGVYDFQKRSSLIICTEDSASELASTASILAYEEGLTAHARSAEYRIKP